MSFLSRLFAKKNDEDYETILSSLARDIQKRQVQLSEIRLRERRSTLLVTLYILAAWVAYVSLWYAHLLPDMSGHGRSKGFVKAVKAVPVIMGPIIALFIRRIVQIWYERKGNAEEKMLQNLLKQQRSKVEEIKKKTNYYSTRDLIQRYDESQASPVVRQRLVPVQTQPNTPQRPMPQNGVRTPVPINPVSPASPPAASPPTGPHNRQWYDKLADALLGDEDVSNSPSSRFALICEKCFAHNGLVKEAMWEDAQYVCPKCNHFNASMRSKAQRRRGVAATQSPSPPPPTTPPRPRQPSPPAPSSPPSNDKDDTVMDVDHS